MEIRDNPPVETARSMLEKGEGMESAKVAAVRRGGIGIGNIVTYIENSPEKSVVLSPRLQQLIRDVAGCQTEQVEAVIRRVMFELLSR